MVGSSTADSDERSSILCLAAPNPKRRLRASSAWAASSLNCFRQKLVCSLTISDGFLAPVAKLLARSKPKFKFLWVISITLRFTVAALWFAASRNFVIEYIAASASCWRHTRIASGAPRPSRTTFGYNWACLSASCVRSPIRPPDALQPPRDRQPPCCATTLAAYRDEALEWPRAKARPHQMSTRLPPLIRTLG